MQQVALELAAHGDSARAVEAMERAVRWLSTDDTTLAFSHFGSLPHLVHALHVLHFHIDPAFASLRKPATMRRWILPRG